MDFTPAEFPTTGVSEKEFIDKMIALAKAGEDEMEHLKCVFLKEVVILQFKGVLKNQTIIQINRKIIQCTCFLLLLSFTLLAKIN